MKTEGGYAEKLQEVSKLLQNDLAIIKCFMVPCFPDEWKLWEFLSQEYEMNVKAIVDDAIKNFSQISNGDILLLGNLQLLPLILQPTG